MIVAFFIGPPLFVLVELSPTAWAAALTITLLVNNPRLLLASRSVVLSYLSLALLSLAALAALSALWSQEPARSLKASIQFAAFVLMGGAAAAQLALVSTRQRDRIWNALLTGAAAAIIALAAIEIAAWATEASTARVRSFHKTTFYGLCFASILLFPSKDYLGIRRAMVLFFYAIPTLLLGRTSGVNIMIVMAVPLLFLTRKGLRSVIGAFCLVYVVAALAAPFVVERVYQSVDGSKIATLPQVSSYMARLELWNDLAPRIRESVWLGHGADTTRANTVTFGPMKYYDLPDIPSAHNMIFDIWFELGLAGIVVLLLAIVTASLMTMRLQAGPILVTSIIFLGTIIEFSVDHRIWLSWVQGTLILTIAASVLASLRTTPNWSAK
ncbi:hypothetical protein XI09_42400 [Bradyrhizobium sp. CCBAU 11386]|uniref:O-antigen ligase family protein n=1 Tax=Bradyrhizobium sp. CCBAU 11386 TaxID=1630837 RepID=UPI0023046C13|nr:O-antigen ligase family protein [Bradyrhizobium sp. CCBAU 11386]MDA9511193.1 hypothetical protein [Bradyrhizobium sp. CCBAU 11386]